MVEQLAYNEKVSGSSPLLPSTLTEILGLMHSMHKKVILDLHWVGYQKKRKENSITKSKKYSKACVEKIKAKPLHM